MIRFQVGEQVRVVGLPASELQDLRGVVVKTIERDVSDDDRIQECAVQFPAGRRWLSATHLVRTIPDKALRFLRGEVLERWKDLSPDDVIVLNGSRDELIAFLQERYGFSLKRAAIEVDDFLGQMEQRFRSASDLPLNRNAQVA